MDLGHLLTDRHEICTRVWCGWMQKTYFCNFFPTSK